MGQPQFEPLYIAGQKEQPEFVGLGNQLIENSVFSVLGSSSAKPDPHDVLSEEGLETQDRIARIEEEAYENGFSQGEKDGFEIGEQKGAKLVERLEALLMELQQLPKHIIQQSEKELVDIVFKIAAKVVHQQMKDENNTIATTILDAIYLAAEKKEITLRVNPEDYELVEKLRPEIFSSIRELKTMTVTSDVSVTRGGCLLETARGNIDASIETQLKKISEALEVAYLEENAD
jgi:flagellar assembly protein FliH